MSVLLGCITDRSDLALQVARLLNRSEVVVNIRNGVPNNRANYPAATFEIILISSCDSQECQLAQATDWLSANGALRYWIIHDEPIDSLNFLKYQDIGDTVASLLPVSNAEDIELIEQMILHCQYQDDACLAPPPDYSAIICLRSNAVEFGHLSVFNEMKSLTNASNRHVAVRVDHAEEILTLVRACERLRIISGNPRLALFLPAQLRLRGWLTSDHQLDADPGWRLHLTSDSALQILNQETIESFLQNPELEILQLGKAESSSLCIGIAVINDQLSGVELTLDDALT
jgi:hypothetical protein